MGKKVAFKAAKKPTNIKKERKKFQKQNMKLVNPKFSVILKNLPFSANRKDVKKLLKECGQIKYVKIVREKNSNLAGHGIVEFSSVQGAEKAVKSYSGIIFKGRKIKVHPNAKESSESSEVCIFKSQDLQKSVESSEIAQSNSQNTKHEPQVDINNIIEMRRRKFRKGRVIVRNLPFQVTEQKIRKLFKQFGVIYEINLPKNNAGKKMGCGFVQFKTKESAMQAVAKMNGHNVMGRTIICDMAVPKDKYLSQISDEKHLGEVKIKEEPLSDSDNETHDIKPNDFLHLDTSEIKNEKEDVNVWSEKDDRDDDDDTDDIDDDDDDDDIDQDYDDDSEGSDDTISVKEEEEDDYSQSQFTSERKRNDEKKPKVVSNDVTEGCTVFLKNLPFSTTEEELKKCMSQFGPVWYTKICIDHLTEHPKGSAFVKFKKKENAEKCLEQSGVLTLDDNAIEILPALQRNEIKSLCEKRKEKISKDNRHLYLAREGAIMAGSSAAKGVSVADMEKRLSIEQWKNQMLRNLHMFVSNTRLIIYNLPLTWKDDDVRKLFRKYSEKGAKITEARVMRNKKGGAGGGLGSSKGFAFVRFTKHEDALNALRNINNNPNIFSSEKRPIVTFSIENKAILHIKEKRLEKSRRNNQKQQNYEKKPKGGVKQNQPTSGQNLKSPADGHVQHSFAGEIGKPGSKPMRSRTKLLAQAVQHKENVKKRKANENRIANRNKKPKQVVIPQAKQNNVDRLNDTLGNLIAKYKASVGSLEAQKRWYE